jgi:prepilin-type processing-associated H-X9-DG protein
LNGSKWNWRHRVYGIAMDNKWKPRPEWKRRYSPDSITVQANVVDYPTDFPYFADTGKLHADGEFKQHLGFQWHRAESQLHTRHSGAANLWFIDGHTDSLRPPSLKELGIFGGFTEHQIQVAY